jgi:hypothetical protein
MGLEYNLCDTDVEIGQLFSQYDLCSETIRDPSRKGGVNDMVLADAIKISHALHEKLTFEVRDGAIFPYAFDDDTLLACKLTENADAHAHCETIEKRMESGQDIAVIPSPEAAAALAPALNELYKTGDAASSAIIASLSAVAAVAVVTAH